MTPLTVLLTNDDGVQSPLYTSLYRAVAGSSWCRELRAVAPAEEQSWVAQAMSRHNPVFVSEFTGEAGSGLAVSGTPADCVSLGALTLFDSPPQLVISGINIGTNAGLAFYLSSGTVGAARQAFLHGIPSVAFSVALSLEVYDAWSAHNMSALANYAADFQRIADAAAAVTTRLVEGDAWRYADLFSVNLPWEADSDTEVVTTELEHTTYVSLFTQVGAREYIHQPKSFPVRETREEKRQLPSDISVLARGKISLTPLKYDLRVRDSEHLAKLKALWSGKGSQFSPK